MGTVSTYLEESVQKELLLIFGKAYEGLQTAAISFLTLRKKALRDIKGIFSGSEIMALVDIHNATMFDPNIAAMPGALVASIEDSNNLDGLGAKWSVDIDKLISKVGSLSDYQVFFLSFECYSFWYGKNAGNDLDSFCKKF
jgi:hypothetical protein